MNEPKEETKIEPKVTPTKAKWFRLSKLTIIMAIVAIVAIIACLILYLTNKGQGGASITTKPDTAEEIKIKQYLSSLRGDIVRYSEDKQTFEGWTPNQKAIDEVKKAGSELKTQALTKDTYIIYAKMPSSKTVFCMDHNGFTSEITSLMPWAKACE